MDPDNKENFGNSEINRKEFEVLFTTEREFQSDSKKAESLLKKLNEIEIKEYHMLLEDITYQKKLFNYKFTDISKASDLPISTVKRIIYGHSFPKITTFIKLLNAMGLTLCIKRKGN